MGEVKLKVEHCLITKEEIDFKLIERVYSHPQALAQCEEFLSKNLPSCQVIPAYDTAGSVKMVKELNKGNCACIASKDAAEIYNMPIILDNIANNLNNYTRFLMLSKKKSPKTGNDKTSIIFSIKHEPGSLHRIIENFHKNSVNLTKIESRPTKANTW